MSCDPNYLPPPSVGLDRIPDFNHFYRDRRLEKLQSRDGFVVIVFLLVKYFALG